ncbi:MAG: PTS glucose transporter subunit IIA [Bacillota bacterium]|nr:PTS glucose transporter subunit IIA [Bacillota bacterium]
MDLLKKNIQVMAPIDGKVIDLSEVDDRVFSQRLAGDGVAIASTGDTVVAPVGGKISFMFKTNHAFVITAANGVQVLVHIGTDTLNLHGEGFKNLKEMGDTVKIGDEILKLDRNFIEEKGCCLVVPVLITKPEEVEFLQMNIGDLVRAGQETIMRYKLVKNKEF